MKKMKNSAIVLLLMFFTVAIGAEEAAPPGMAWIPEGTFWMGSDEDGMRDTQPWHQVTVNGFWIDIAPVTNAEFAAFVKATGYITTAEKPLSLKDYPHATAKELEPAGIVFHSPKAPIDMRKPLSWWRLIPGASWQHPEGTDSTWKGREEHPVVQVSWDDAVAYAAWAGKRLPTEAEWERAARGGEEKKIYVWGNEFKPEGKWQANIWQGNFPYENSGEDGFVGTSPVKSFPSNQYGLYDMSGNVWEWCNDWYDYRYYSSSPKENPKGPAESNDLNEPLVAKKVLRGGSFLCCDQYCRRYVPGGRGKNAVDSGTSNIGFRCVKDKP